MSLVLSLGCRRVFVNYSEDLSGSTIALLRLLSGSPGVSSENLLLCSPGSACEELAKKSGFVTKAVRIPRVQASLSPLFWVNYLWRSLVFNLFLCRLLFFKQKPRLLVNSVFNLGGWPAYLLLHLCGCRVDWWVHELSQEPKWFFSLARKLVSLASTKVFCVSTLVLEYFPRKGVLLPNAAPEVAVEEPSLPDATRGLELVWLGSLHRRKGLDHLPGLLHQLSSCAKLKNLELVVSLSEKYRPYLEFCVESIREVMPEVVVHENVQNVEKHLFSHKLLLQTSRLPESFSLAVLEGMSHGMLVVSSPLGGVQDFGIHLKNLFFLEKGLQLECSSFSALLSDRAALKEIQNNAFCTARKYSSENAWKIVALA